MFYTNVLSKAVMMEDLVDLYRAKSTECLERYHKILQPKGILDLVRYLWSDRMIKDSAVLRVLHEEKESLERVVSEAIRYIQRQEAKGERKIRII